MPTGTRLLIPLLATVLGSLVLAGPTAADPPQLETKRAQAEAVLAEVRAIDMELSLAVDAWNGANVRLAAIERDLAANERRLRVARTSLRGARATVEARLVALYTSEEPDAVEVILGASSIADLVDRIDAANRIAEDDARIAAEVRAYRDEVERGRSALVAARAEQEDVVARRAAKRAEIESRLRERETLYASVREEIAVLEAEERRRQARLAAEARRQAAALERRQAQARPESEATAPEPAPAPEPEPAPAPAPAPAPQPAPAPSPPPAGPGHPEVVSIALRYLGIPYRWGGASPSTGFDCSGFVMYVYGRIGISLPHHAASQYRYGRPVARSQLAPGDLVFFNGLGHNGIYIGGGRFVHSPHTGDVVKISSIWDSWYAATWVGARRLG